MSEPTTTDTRALDTQVAETVFGWQRYCYPLSGSAYDRDTYWLGEPGMEERSNTIALAPANAPASYEARRLVPRYSTDANANEMVVEWLGRTALSDHTLSMEMHGADWCIGYRTMDYEDGWAWDLIVAPVENKSRLVAVAEFALAVAEWRKCK